MKKKLIIINSFPTSSSFFNKVQSLIRKKKNFIYIDLSKLFFPQKKLENFFKGKKTYKADIKEIIIFKEKKRFEIFLEKNKDKIIIWYLCRFYKLIDDDWIIDLFNKNNIAYYFQHFDPYLKPKSLFNSFSNLIKLIKHRITNNICKPHAVVTSGTQGELDVKNLYPNANVLNIPSVKINWKLNTSKNNYAVFVDENIEYTPDAKLLGIKFCDDINGYYYRLKKLFNKIEKWYDIKVLIAASGKTFYKNPKKRFGSRKVYYNNTQNLIVKSKFVIGHVSIALDQAIVSRKKTIIIDDISFLKEKRQLFKQTLLKFDTDKFYSDEIKKKDIDYILKRNNFIQRNKIIKKIFRNNKNLKSEIF